MPCKECENGKYKFGNTGECKYDTLTECQQDNKDYYEKTTSIVELVIADESEELAIDAISLVNSPAIEQDFVFFGKEKNNLTFAKVDEEKRMLVSPALIPNKHIFRYDPNTDSEYYVFFRPETIRKASELYLKHNNHHKATYQHEDRVSGVLTIESWIKEGEQDKSKLYGFDLPDGTWFVKMKIENDEMWNKIKDGELKGLSIEGYFINKMEKMGKQQFSNEEIREAIKELLSVQKVELGSLDELKKAAKRIEEDNNFMDSNKKISLKKIEEARLSIWVDADQAEKSLNRYVHPILNKFTKAAKELGIKAESVPEFQKVLKERDKLEQRIVKQKKEYK